MTLAADERGYEVDVERVMHGAIPRVDGDAMSCIQINLALGQVEAARADGAGSSEREEEIDDAAKHEEREHCNPKARSSAAPPPSTRPRCREERRANDRSGGGDGGGSQGRDGVD